MIVFEGARCYEIRQKACKLLEELNIDTSAAIDIREIITSLEKPISLKITDLKGLPGFTCYDRKKDRYRIFADENLLRGCPTRFKFTVAHELGHIILNHFTYTDNSLYMDYIMEREANIFVDELLMPTEAILRQRFNAKEVAEIYRVSASAAYNKMTHIKANALYKEIQAKIVAEMFGYSSDRYIDMDNRYKVVERLHDLWLDPDYRFGGI